MEEKAITKFEGDRPHFPIGIPSLDHVLTSNLYQFLNPLKAQI